jgi:hypothetical protein
VVVVASRVKIAFLIGDKTTHKILRSSKKERPLVFDLIILITLALEISPV